MNLLKTFQEKFTVGMETFSAKVSENKFIKALTAGFMSIMPITLGTALVAILGNLPIAPWKNFLESSGLYQVSQDFISLTLSLLAIYVVIAVSYQYTKNEGKNGIMGAIISTATFISLMPMQSAMVEGAAAPASMLLTSNMGSDGIFVAMICGLLVPWVFCKLMDKGIKINLPKSVPPMVSESISPTFVAMIMFTSVFSIKYLCTLTSYGNLFTMVNKFISEPIMKLGANNTAIILLFTFMNLCWFFGIHPNTILSCYMPVLMASQTANIQAYTSGQVLPYASFAIVGVAVYVGGAGNTLGLCLSTLFAKSEKYKTMRKLVIPANIFNINEPIIFGFPTILNPLYFVPMVFSSIASGVAAVFLAKVLPINLNPTVSMPWVTPGFITAFLQGGIWLLVVWIVSLLIHFALYLPFFKMDDNKAYQEEKAAESK